MLATAVVLMPLVALGLRVLGLARLREWLPASSGPGLRKGPTVEPARMGFLVNAAANHGLVRASCLTRSLLLDWLLRRAGVAGELRIGVRTAGGALDAHAWVELDGRPLNDAPDVSVRYGAFESLPPPESFTSP